MRIVVIGGTGFIREFLVAQLLGAGHEVAVVQRADSAVPLPIAVFPVTPATQ
jgi:uncharacterized protein YbjT (DUF2867 family)